MQSQAGTIISDGAAINVNCGFLPDIVRVRNGMAAAGEIALFEYHRALGDAKGFSHLKLTDNGTTATDTINYVTSGGPISAYDTTAIDAGTSNDDDDPVRLAGYKGFTIAAAFSDDNDVLTWEAMVFDRVNDMGDISA